MQIARADKDDVCDIARLLRYCVGERADREAAEYLQNPDAVTLKAVKDGVTVGFITLLISFENADLLDIAVDENYRRQGIAKTLLKSAAAQTGVRSLILEVRESNIPARQFYEKQGFKEISKRKKYYTAPVEDAIIYMRET